MQEKLTTLIDEFEKIYERIPESNHRLKPSHIRTLADLSSVIAVKLLLNQLSGQSAHNKANHSVEESIVDELSGAESKYLEYIKNQDPSALNMARDELRHASYYLTQAKMSHDAGLQQRLKDYHAWYSNIETKINKSQQ